jgi:hypothetical protein
MVLRMLILNEHWWDSFEALIRAPTAKRLPFLNVVIRHDQNFRKWHFKKSFWISFKIVKIFIQSCGCFVVDGKWYTDPFNADGWVIRNTCHSSYNNISIFNSLSLSLSVPHPTQPYSTLSLSLSMCISHTHDNMSKANSRESQAIVTL